MVGTNKGKETDVIHNNSHSKACSTQIFPISKLVLYYNFSLFPLSALKKKEYNKFSAG